MKTAVLVPSHIYYPDQLERLDTCLESLCSQTIVPDIFVSISFANDTYKGEFSTLLRKYPTVKFKLSGKQKFQIEHLASLSLLVSDYDMIMFCDDDDTYHPIRVEKFIEAFEFIKENSNKTGIQLGGVRETRTNINEKPEYWTYGIQPSLLNQFFSRIKGYEDLMRHKFADMYLRNFLGRTGGNYIGFAVFPPEESMYEYTTDNPNSICARNMSQEQTIETGIDIIRDNLILGIIENNTKMVKKTLKCASIPFSRLNEILPSNKRIQTLTNILYK